MSGVRNEAKIDAPKSSQYEKVIDEILQTERDFVDHMELLKIIINETLKENPNLSDDNKAFLQNYVVSLDRYTNPNYNPILKALNGNIQNLGFEQKKNRLLTVLNSKEMEAYYHDFRLMATSQDQLIKIFKEDELALKFKKITDSNKKKFSNLGIDSFISKPFQRIAKYPLFYNDLIKKAADESPTDKELLSTIAAKGKVGLDLINDMEYLPQQLISPFYALNAAILAIPDQENLKNLRKEMLDLIPKKNYLWNKVLTRSRDQLTANEYNLRKKIEEAVNEEKELAVKEKRAAKADHLIQQEVIKANQSLFKNTEKENYDRLAQALLKLKARVVLPDIHPWLLEDTAIVETLNNSQTTDEVLALLKQKNRASWNLIGRARDTIIKQVKSSNKEEYPEKIEFIKHLSAAATDFAKFAPTTTKPARLQGSADIVALEKAFDQKWQPITDSPDEDVLSHYTHFNEDLAEINNLIFAVKNDDKDIATLDQMIKDLKKNTSYVGKYARYNTLKAEMESQLESMRKERMVKLKSLPKKEVEFSKKYQLALIAAEKQKTAEILLNKKAEQLHFRKIKWPNPGANTMQAILRNYQTDVGIIDRQLKVQSELERQKSETTLRENISTLDKPIGPVDNHIVENARAAVDTAYEKYAKYFVAESTKLAEAIATNTTIKVKETYKKVIDDTYKMWKTNKKYFNHPQSIDNQVKILKDACEMMDCLVTSQRTLIGAGKGYIIDENAYKELYALLDQKHLFRKLKLDADSEDDKVRWTEEFAKFKSKPEYNALPKVIVWELDKLNKVIHKHYEKRESISKVISKKAKGILHIVTGGLFKPKNDKDTAAIPGSKKPDRGSRDGK